MISKHLSDCRGKKILEVYIELLILNTDIAKKIGTIGVREAAPNKQLNRRMTLHFLSKTGSFSCLFYSGRAAQVNLPQVLFTEKAGYLQIF
mgnify:CR=1 FL=1